MTNTTLVTAAQLATAQTRAIDIANLAKVVAPTATFKFLALLDGTRNIASNPAYSRDAQPTSIGQLSIQLKTLQDQGLLPSNAGYSYRAGVGTPGTQAGSALNPTQQAENTAKEVYKEYAEAAYEWRQDNPGGDITAMMVSFSRGNYTATIFAQKLYVEGLVYTGINGGQNPIVFN